MHESSLGGMLTDYLSGAKIEETTYEEFRQALARLLVEKKGYPKDRLKAKVPLAFAAGDKTAERVIDLVAYDESGAPALILVFCPGDVGSFERETVSCARLLPGGPVPLAVATDTIGASVLDTATGECIANGAVHIPDWEAVRAKSAATPRTPLAPERRRKEERILYAYTGLVSEACCGDTCRLPPKTPPAGGR